MKSLLYQVTFTPPAVAETFGGNNFYNFGRMAFGYTLKSPFDQNQAVWYGPTHWLDQIQGRLIPEFPNPTYISFYLKPGCIMNLAVDAEVGSEGIGAAVNGVITSFIGGQANNLH